MITEVEMLESEYQYVKLTLEEIEINVEFATNRKQIKVLKMWKIKKSEIEDMLCNVLILLSREKQSVSGSNAYNAHF